MESHISGSPLLTIGVPTYNGSRTIRNMLDIMLPQVDFTKVEVLVSDNCSTDDTSKIISEYKIKYPQIRVISNETNIGADGNFLQCMKYATGKFTMLISDDDIIIENAVPTIVNFLKSHPNISLAYLESVGFQDKYVSKDVCTVFHIHSKYIEKSFVTSDKKVFFPYVDRMWGFTSSFLWKTSRFKEIENPERFFGTYWLQSYIHILCTNRNDELGVIKGPCIAAGGYGIIGNYDTAEVEAVQYKKMLEYAVEKAGYDKTQLTDLYIWKVCYLARNAIIKERAANVKKTSIRKLFVNTWKYPQMWFYLYPYTLIPPFLCGFLLNMYRKFKGRKTGTYVNRPT